MRLRYTHPNHYSTCFQRITLGHYHELPKFGTMNWVWSGESLPVLDSYSCLGVEFSSDGSWKKHTKSLVVHNKQKLGILYPVLHHFA